ncbi:MAG: class I SAM-dependent methyltransferase [Terriglobia bacterium]
MAWFTSRRQPEPEVMDEPGEVEAYASSAAQAYLNGVDNTFVEQVLDLNVAEGWALDVGAGPGSILLKIAERSPGLKLMGVDRSPAMITYARRSASAQGLTGRVNFCLADAVRLPFVDERFAIIWSNSVLHHLSDPAMAFSEISRVAKAGGVVLLRDLRRPSRLALAPHIALYGRHYTGTMKRLYGDSVRAAYTRTEFEEMVRQSALAGAQIFLHRRTHLGLAWKKKAGRLEFK